MNEKFKNKSNFKDCAYKHTGASFGIHKYIDDNQNDEYGDIN